MSAAAFCNTLASTRRPVDLTGGKRGPAVTHLSSLLITPLWPVGGETIRTLALNSPQEMKECFHVPVGGVTLPDVREGDFLVVGAASYPVDHVSEWTDNAIPTLHIVVGEVKNA